PPAKHRVDLGDDLTEIRVASALRGQLLHALPDPLHRALRGTPGQELQPLGALLPDPSAQTLVQVAAEEGEALLSILQLGSPRLVRVQLEPEPPQDDPDAF